MTQDEWYKMWSECMNKPQGDMPEWFKKYMTFMFSVNDTSGNSNLSERSFTQKHFSVCRTSMSSRKIEALSSLLDLLSIFQFGLLVFVTCPGDELIDMKEYTTVYTSYGLQRDECEKAFKNFADVSRTVASEKGVSFDPCDNSFGFRTDCVRRSPSA